MANVHVVQIEIIEQLNKRMWGVLEEPPSRLYCERGGVHQASQQEQVLDDFHRHHGVRRAMRLRQGVPISYCWKITLGNAWLAMAIPELLCLSSFADQ